MRIVFFGTPEFAVPTLDALAARHEIVGVVAQPDKRAGRGLHLQSPPVAQRARDLGLRVLQPSRVRDESFLQSIRELEPDAGVVIAYGRILPAALLSIPRHGFLNVHGSILPKYRGAAPIQRAIEAGETMTGVTIMRVDEELDHGPMLRVATTDIGPHDQAPQVAARLASLGAEAMLAVLDEIERGVAVETPQDHAAATHAAKIEKAEGEVTWREDATNIYNRFRAFEPWPGVFTATGGEVVKLVEMKPEPIATSIGPRTIAAIDEEGVIVAARNGAIRLQRLQRPGKTRMSAVDVARTLGWRAGSELPD